MTLTVSTGTALLDLLKNDPALCEELRGTSSRQELNKKLAAAAAAKGIMIDEEALDKTIALGVKHLYESGAELTEEDLENITGGIALSTIFGVAAGVTAVLFGTSLLVGWLARDYLTKT